MIQIFLVWGFVSAASWRGVTEMPLAEPSERGRMMVKSEEHLSQVEAVHQAYPLHQCPHGPKYHFPKAKASGHNPELSQLAAGKAMCFQCASSVQVFGSPSCGEVGGCQSIRWSLVLRHSR